eukprot:TRINITY_DN60525_c0_g1_i1.p1 TRINITY_DN60525_c0_g1~~TRINITY_DN60525_c0_g1_i1.p1  ORF type:complete len:744 (+),score=105.99 TRINITY_DN60525_c0_g1_i1:161-2233(+)
MLANGSRWGLGLLQKKLDRGKTGIVLDLSTSSHGDQVCPDTRPTNYYQLPSKVFTAGIPQNYGTLGVAMTTCEMYELQKYCVSAINVYRAGGVRFGDGRMRDHGTLAPLKNPGTPMLQCLNEKALSDLKHAQDGNGCGHYTFSESCGHGVRPSAENSCCPRSCSSLESCKAMLDGCLKSMWDEGELVLDGQTSWSTSTGHYWNMIGNHEYVVCGFGFDENSKVLASQNFYGSAAESRPCAYNCDFVTSEETECGNCFGVEYCQTDSECSNPPTCFEPAGVCKNGRCSYDVPATVCEAGTCQAGVCVQNCFDTSCDHCTTERQGGCDTCKSGTSLIDGCCVEADCVTVSSGSWFDGTYLQVGEYNGYASYYNDKVDKYLVMYCCGWGWSITNSKTGGGAYQVSHFAAGKAVDSSGKWDGKPAITVNQCHTACLGNTTCDTPPECHKPSGSCGAGGCIYEVDQGASCASGICDANGVCWPTTSTTTLIATSTAVQSTTSTTSVDATIVASTTPEAASTTASSIGTIPGGLRWVNMSADRWSVCRGSDPNDNKAEYYEVFGAISTLETCKMKCALTPFCTGVEYNPRGRCEVWKHPIDSLSNLVGYHCLKYAPKTTLVPVGESTVCRGEHPADNSNLYYDLASVAHVEECKAHCAASSLCYGVEFSGHRCEVWKRPIKSTNKLGGFTCFRWDN